MTFTRFAAFVGALTVALFAVLASPLLGQTVDPLAPLPPPYAAFLPPVPGAVNPAVTEATKARTICRSGWTKTVRPPTAYTNKVKFALMDAAGIPRSDARQFELDHALPIEDGGDTGYALGQTKMPLNLWLQPYRGKYCTHYCSQDKDVLETFLKRAICRGDVSLAEAQLELTTDWIEAYTARIGPLP